MSALNVIKVDLDKASSGDFPAARREAEKAAREKLGGRPVLWSWYDSQTGRKSPPVDCCGDDCNPAWEVYALARGGNLKVEVDNGRYRFYFGPGSE